MNKYLIILILTGYIGFGNLYGQEIDTIPPEINFSWSDYHLSFDVFSPNGDLIDSVINVYDTESYLIENESTYESGYIWQIGDSIYYNKPNYFWFKPNFTGELTIKLFYNSAELKDSLIKKYNVVREDTIAPKFEINSGALRNYFPYDEYFDSEENVLAINAGWCDKFPEDFINTNTNKYFTINDNSELVNVTYKDSLYQGYLIRYYEAMDTSGNKSNLEVRVTRSPTPGQISNLYVYINDSKEPIFFDPGDDSEKEVDLCDKTEVKIDAVPQLVCADHSANYSWYINDIAVFTESSSSLVFNLDTMGYETKVSVTVSESGSINGRMKIVKSTDELVKSIVQPSCNQSNDGSIRLDNVNDVVWAHNGSTKEYLENLGPGVYPVSYKCHGDCVFNDTINLVPDNILEFTVSNTSIDLNQNEKLTIYNHSTGFDKLFWQIGNSSIITNNLDKFDYTFNIPGTYKIKLADYNGSCSDTIYRIISVEGLTDADDYLNSAIKIGPNPFKDYLNIVFEKTSDYNIKIFNIDGRVYYMDKVYAKDKIQTDLRFLPPGVYVLNITFLYENKPDKDFKIVKLTGD